MKRFKSSSLVIVFSLVLAACGGQAVPTINAADVQSTAVAAAFTMVAQTQAAIPTATPLPPTDTPTVTPLPTDTPVPLPTTDANAVPTTGQAAGGPTVDPCSNRVLAASPKGKSTIIRIANLTKAAVNVSLYLNRTEGAGECGYRGYTLTKLGDVVITDLVQGCYNLWAWSKDGEKVHVNVGGFGCINNTDKWTFEINENTIKFTQ